jgi:hypothetical protein
VAGTPYPYPFAAPLAPPFSQPLAAPASSRRQDALAFNGLHRQLHLQRVNDQFETDERIEKGVSHLEKSLEFGAAHPPKHTETFLCRFPHPDRSYLLG